VVPATPHRAVACKLRGNRSIVGGMSSRHYFTIDQASDLLQVSSAALRARCRRAARRRGKDVVAELADGILAIKFGRSWRIRFPGHATDQGGPARFAAMEEDHGS